MSLPPKQTNTGSRISWTAVQVARVAGIPIRVHFTFWLFLVWFSSIAARPNAKLQAALTVVTVFACVVLHELGHALTAKRYGIKTQDITLYPIGGVATITGRRPKASEEFWIALAGPMVNVVIALILLPIAMATEGHIDGLRSNVAEGSVLQLVLAANIVLACFNLIPAFPMDGGRILRALLAMRIGQVRATRIAAAVGQFLALALGAYALLVVSNPVLLLISFFVFLGAGQEVKAIDTIGLVDNQLVRDAMMTQFATINSGESLREAAKMLLAGSQRDFPVVVGEEVVGVLSREAITLGMSYEGDNAYVAGLMNRVFHSIEPEAPLARVLEWFSKGERTPVMVLDGGLLVGIVTPENLGEFLMLKQASLHRMHDPRSAAP